MYIDCIDQVASGRFASLVAGFQVRIVTWLEHVGVTFALLSLVSPTLVVSAEPDPRPAGQRDQLTASALMSVVARPEHPVHNAYFMPVGESASALHAFSGTLSIPETLMQMTTTKNESHAWFPKVDLQFVSHGHHLIPVERDIIRGAGERSFWRIILSPGQIWSETGDGGLSRASFPFVLSGPESNESHNGVATFVLEDSRVSSLWFQIVQESAFWNRFDAWGRLDPAYTPNSTNQPSSVVDDFKAELARRLPIRPWADLGAEHGATHLGAFNNWGKTEHISTSGLIVDDVIHMRPCVTRHGDYPYCGEMRHGVYSVTKTLGALLSLLRLAQKYGDAVFDLKIADYVNVTAAHDGWKDVTFADAINMVTGIGDKSDDPASTDRDEDDTDLFGRFVSARSAREKLQVAFSGGHYPWGPGKVLRYRSIDSFMLAAAMDAFLKSREGADANLWDMISEEVLRPIGVFHAPMMHTEESDGSRGIPILGWGLFVTVEDVAKTARLFQDGGQYRGRQLLSATKLEEALYQTSLRGNAMSVRPFSYFMSFWHLPVKTHRCHVNIPQMTGYGGNIVQLLPSNMVSFYFQDSRNSPALEVAQAAKQIRPYCPQ